EDALQPTEPSGSSAAAQLKPVQMRSVLHWPHRWELLISSNVCYQFLDPDGDSEDTPGCSAHSFTDCSLGHMTCNRPLHRLKSRSSVHLLDSLSGTRALVRKAASGALSALEAEDMDMQPAGAGLPKARVSTAQLPGSPEDLRMMEEDRGTPLPIVEPLETGGRAQGRARVSRPPPRLGNERDKGPKLSLSKRKLEVLLTEPEKNKRKQQHVA
uniref:Uncharacterized protein n=1 Tax=Rhinolophus ferrumequinum TaxID=59479 RepID=A0A671DWU7_RHIFE